MQKVLPTKRATAYLDFLSATLRCAKENSTPFIRSTNNFNQLLNTVFDLISGVF